jgi:hypothetical protein
MGSAQLASRLSLPRRTRSAVWFTPAFARVHPADCPGSVSGLAVLPRAAAREAFTSLPQGPSLRSGLFCPGPSSLSRPHPPVSQAQWDFAAEPFIPTAFAVRGAAATHETFPTFTAVLSQRAVDPAPVGPQFCPISPLRCQASSLEDRVATHKYRLCQQCSTGMGFRRCIVRFMLRPADLPRPPGWLRRRVDCTPRLLRTLSPPLLPPLVAERRWGSG